MDLVSRFSVRGVLASILLLLLVAGVSGDESCSFVKTWSYAAGSGTIPPDISLDPSGAVYVTSPEDGRVLRYSPERELTTYWVLNDTESGISVVPAGIVADGSRIIFVTDNKNSTIIRLSLFKKELWGREGSGNEEFNHPAGIAVDSSGTVYVADAGNNRVQKIHSGGNYLLQWGSYGTARGAFHTPGSIAIDAQDHVYVTDAGNSRIQKFTSDGTALVEWGSKGTGAGQFLAPSGIAVDKWGNVYVADQTARVQKFSPTGEYFSTCNTSNTAYDVAVGPSGEVFVIMQSGSSWEIGEFRYSSLVSQEAPVQRSTSAVPVPRTPGISITPKASDTPPRITSVQNPETGKTDLIISPEVSVENNTSAALIPAMLEMPVTGAAENLREEGALVAGRETGVFDRISQFFRSVFEMRIPFLP